MDKFSAGGCSCGRFIILQRIVAQNRWMNHMWIFFPLFIGISLAMDALAASVALGAAERKNFTWQKILLTAFFFGFFQMFMPDAGWFGASLCGNFVIILGRITAFLLLAFLGGKMLFEVWKKSREKEKEKPEIKEKFSFFRLIALSFATSIDALLVGVSYACMERKGIWRDSLIIGLITFLICLAGCIIGRIAGNRFDKKCDIAGGCILIILAFKILLFE